MHPPLCTHTRICFLCSFVLPSLICSCSCVSVSSTTSHPLGNLIFRDERTFGIATVGEKGTGASRTTGKGAAQWCAVRCSAVGVEWRAKPRAQKLALLCKPPALPCLRACPVLSSVPAAAAAERERGGTGAPHSTHRGRWRSLPHFVPPRPCVLAPVPVPRRSFCLLLTWRSRRAPDEERGVKPQGTDRKKISGPR